MKSVLISIRPQWCEKIASGKKTIEVRKTAPKEVPFKAYIYCSYGDMKTNYYLKGRGKVIGEFICDKVDKYEPQVILCAYYEVNGAYVKENLRYNSGTCLSYEDMVNYSNGKTIYGWHITDLKLYDKPKKLDEFNHSCNYAGLCFSCDRAKFTSKGDRICRAMITRAPQSWQYVEEVKE